MTKRVLLAAAFGVLLTLVLLGLALAAAGAGYESLASVLFWQNSLLQGLAPLGNVGTPENPIYEGTPLNFLAFLASLPLGFVFYGGAAYYGLRFLGRRA
jgi:hypothetical protein